MALQDIENFTRSVHIDGEDYTLQFDYAAYALAEKLCEKSVYQLRDEFLEAKISLKHQLILLYCALIRHHPSFDINKIKNEKRIGHVLNISLKPLAEAFFHPLMPPEILENLEKS